MTDTVPSDTKSVKLHSLSLFLSLIIPLSRFVVCYFQEFQSPSLASLSLSLSSFHCFKLSDLLSLVCNRCKVYFCVVLLSLYLVLSHLSVCNHPKLWLFCLSCAFSRNIYSITSCTACASAPISHSFHSCNIGVKCTPASLSCISPPYTLCSAERIWRACTACRTLCTI